MRIAALPPLFFNRKNIFQCLILKQLHYRIIFLGYHAVGGPITVEVPPYYSELKQAAYEAATELGFEILDSNAERHFVKKCYNNSKRFW